MQDRIEQRAPNTLVVKKQARELFDEEEDVGLLQSIKEHGILVPLLAHREGDTVVLDDGERRLRAAKRAGLAAVPVIIESRDLPAADVLQLQLVTTCQRRDLSPLEKARAIARLKKETNWPAAQIAMKLGLSPATVSRLTALLDLPEAVQARVGKGEVAASTAYQIGRTGNASDQERLADVAAEGGLTRDAAAGKRKKDPANREAGPSRARSRIVASLPGGRSLTFAGAALVSVDDLITWLEDLLVKARKARPRGVELPTFLALLKDESKAALGEQPC